MRRGGIDHYTLRPATGRPLAGMVAGVFLLIALAVALWYALDVRGVHIATLTPTDVESFVEEWGAWSAVGSIALMVLHSFLPLPAEIIPIMNGMMFGHWLGIALTWIGAMLGAVLSFALARWLGRPFVRLVISERHWQRIEGFSVTPRALLLMRLVPLISFNLVNYAAGLLGVGWWTFLWTTALGILPLTILMVLIGGQILALPAWIWLLAGVILVALWLFLRRRA